MQRTILSTLSDARKKRRNAFAIGSSTALKDTEGLLALNDTLHFVSDDIEPDRLGKGTALSEGDNITFLYGKGRRAMSGNVRVTLLETTVLGNVVQVITSDDNCSLHLGGHDNSLHDGTTNRNISGERTLLVNIVSFDSGRGSLNTETDVLYETHRLVALGANGALTSNKDGILLLVSLFVLIALGIYLSDTGGFDKSHFS